MMADTGPFAYHYNVWLSMAGQTNFQCEIYKKGDYPYWDFSVE